MKLTVLHSTRLATEPDWRNWTAHQGGHTPRQQTLTHKSVVRRRFVFFFSVLVARGSFVTCLFPLTHRQTVFLFILFFCSCGASRQFILCGSHTYTHTQTLFENV